ncbi:MAG: DUF4974 domain-containing protein [Bacteroidales bacterium]|nr:DUF4974 domain-containing protein [Bacteroidales bacterium]
MDEAVLVDYLRGECNGEECRRVEAWIEESPENRKLLEQYYYMLFIADCTDVMDAVDTENSLSNFKLAVRRKERKSRQKEQFSVWRRYAGIAAAFVIGFIFAGGVAWRISSSVGSDYTIFTSEGQRAQTILPDGSKVWLNSSTKLTYRKNFWSTQRMVDLSGEAYFEVAHSSKNAFVVNSKQIKTTVLGTKFDVRARDKEKEVITTLFEGSVQIDTPTEKSKPNLLRPGQTLCVNTTTYDTNLIEYNKPEEVLLWINGKLIFQQHSLLDIARILKKLHNVNFVFEEESLKTEYFTGNFSTDTPPEEVLKVLSYTGSFHYLKEGDVMRIVKK